MQEIAVPNLLLADLSLDVLQRLKTTPQLRAMEEALELGLARMHA